MSNLTAWLERLPVDWGRRHDLEVAWFDAWQPALDEALLHLPEMEGCPHELFRLLCRAPSRATKAVALVTRRGAPVALAGLRRKRWDWEPVGAGMGGVQDIMPTLPGQLFPALSALGRDIHVWGWAGEPPTAIRDPRRMPVWKVDLTGDFEGYWRESGHLNTVKRNRRKTRHLTFDVDAPGAAAWTIRHWATRYQYETNRPADAIDDYLVRASYLQERGRFHAFRLCDGGEPVAGSIGIVHRDNLLWLCPYRSPTHDALGVGSRLLDLICGWAAERGFAAVDLGPTNDYKAKWGPAAAERWSFRVCPPHLEYARRLGRRGRDALASLARFAERGGR